MRGSCVSGGHCGTIAIAIGIGIAATFTPVIANRFVDATAGFEPDSDTDTDLENVCVYRCAVYVYGARSMKPEKAGRTKRALDSHTPLSLTGYEYF